MARRISLSVVVPRIEHGYKGNLVLPSTAEIWNYIYNKAGMT